MPPYCTVCDGYHYSIDDMKRCAIKQNDPSLCKYATNKLHSFVALEYTQSNGTKVNWKNKWICEQCGQLAIRQEKIEYQFILMNEGK